jgi:phosphoglycerol transferase MdoB-like AlkP superfamily enzyme
MRRPMPSLASFLGSQGYVTRALHPYAKWFWNRGTTYKDFGFDEFMSEENLPPLATRGPLVSDKAFFNEIMREADQQKRPFFFFAVTLQNHGPYEPFRYTDPTVDVETTASDTSKQSILSYAEGTHDGDKALASLMDWAKHRKRHTILVMFGDHLPPLGPAYVETGFLKDNVAPRSGPLDKMKMDHETPLVIWSNRSGPVRDVGTISPSLIPLYVLKLAGITHPYYTGFLSQVRDSYPVVYRQMLVTADGKKRSRPIRCSAISAISNTTRCSARNTLRRRSSRRCRPQSRQADEIGAIFVRTTAIWRSNISAHAAAGDGYGRRLRRARFRLT